jgi:hypothetical protein
MLPSNRNTLLLISFSTTNHLLWPARLIAFKDLGNFILPSCTCRYPHSRSDLFNLKARDSSGGLTSCPFLNGALIISLGRGLNTPFMHVRG